MEKKIINAIEKRKDFNCQVGELFYFYVGGILSKLNPMTGEQYFYLKGWKKV